jgi:signal transduction histidine kinase
MPPLPNSDCKVHVLAPFGKDAVLVSQVLESSGIPVELVTNASDIARCVNSGAGAAIVAEEALSHEIIEQLGNSVAAQPAWSDFPIIVLTSGGASTPSTEMLVRSRAPIGNITLIERPVRPATLISSVLTAIRSRLRQFEIRDHLEERKHAEEELRRAHDELESLVEKRTLALRRLSARLMRVQDEERRRIARDLHDGLGQWLAAAQINVDVALSRTSGSVSSILKETRGIIDHAVSSIRTMSYLLHPPLLDEAGFDSAARWFIEGLVKRSGIPIKIDFSHFDDESSGTSKAVRMPDGVELALFRALQEGLTNVHRHAGSPRAEVRFQRWAERAVLEIQDFGRGLPPEVLERFQRTGTGSGVGLAGIRERIKELAGDFTVSSDSTGTILRASVPLSEEVTAPVKPEAPIRTTTQFPERPQVPLATKAAG